MEDTETTGLLPATVAGPKPKWKYFGAACISIVAGVGQGIFLPLFISTFTKTTCDEGIETGSYFVLFILSALFNIPYGVGCLWNYYKGKLTIFMMKRHFRILILMGVFDGLNGLLTVFASALNRTSGDLQAILVQAAIPFTLLFSRLIAGRVITKPKMIATCCVMLGIIIALVPNFIQVNQTGSWVFPILFLIAVIPGVLMNVIQHKVFDADKDYNKNWMLFCESFFQFLTVGLLFWADLIPTFGTSKDMNQFSEHFQFGVQCFFAPGSVGGRCPYSWIIGSAFAVCYCLSYYFSSYLIQHGSANFMAMVSAVCTPIQIIMWYSITPMTKWGCGSEYSKIQIIMGCVAIPFICVGAYAFKYFDKVEVVHNDNENETAADSIN